MAYDTTHFVADITAVGTAHFANAEKGTELCNQPEFPAERALIGQHLDTPELAAAVQREVRDLLEKFAQLVDRTLHGDEPVIQSPARVAQGNAVLNAAHAGVETPITFEGQNLGAHRSDDLPAGFLIELREVTQGIVHKVDTVLDSIIRSGPSFDYVFDIRTSQETARKILIQDVIHLFEDFMRLQTTIDTAVRYVKRHPQTSQGEASLSEVQGAMTGIYLRETQARIQLMQNLFAKLSSDNPPAEMTANLAFFYTDVLDSMKVFASQTMRLLTREATDPAMTAQVTFDPATNRAIEEKLVGLTYPERMRTLLELYRYMILTTNNARRMLVLLNLIDPV